MRHFIFSIPSFIWSILVILPGLFFFLISFEILEFPDRWIILLLIGVQSLSSTIWLASVNDIFSRVNVNSKQRQLIYLLIIVELITILATLSLSMSLLQLIILPLHIILTILLKRNVQPIFEERSPWFLFIELLFTPIGMLTLTSEIKRLTTLQMPEEVNL